MQRIKKSLAVLLFISLIACFVLYRTGFFEEKATSTNSELLVSNFLEPISDSLEIKKLLTINYDVVLELDTLNLIAKKRVKKTFKLRRSNKAIISSSKSAVLYVQSPTKISKDKEILKKLDELNVVQVGFSSNDAFKGLPLDSDLLEVIDLIKNHDFKVDSKLEKYLEDEHKVSNYWRVHKNVVNVHYGKEQNVSVISRSKIDAFLKWYNGHYEERDKEILSMEDSKNLMTSSKSLVVVDNESLIEMFKSVREEWSKERNTFKQKLTEYLNIKF